jgi:uncharacterized protein (TIGR02246 family)
VTQFLPRFVALVAAALVCGCSAQQTGRGVSPDTAAPARATVSAEPGRRTIRPIPEVITKPKPFRLPEAIAAEIRPLDKPATMAARVAGPGPKADALDFPVPTTLPQDDDSGPRPELAEADIREMMRSYLRAFNRHDAAALAAHWSAAGESLDLDTGEKTTGREAVAGVFAALFATDEAAAIDIDIASIKPVRDDVAVIDGVTLTTFSDDTTASSRFSAIVVREGGRWMLSSVREAAAPVPDRPQRPLDALDWLVGSWEDVGEGLTATTHCTWSAGRAFLVRSHVCTPEAVAAPAAEGVPALLPAEGTTREIAEIIGWDPQRGQIRSWIFSSDGRFAEGEWERDGAGDAWTVRFTGQGADAAASCTQTIQRLGDDGLIVGGDGGPLSAAVPPASDFVRTAFFGEE